MKKVKLTRNYMALGLIILSLFCAAVSLVNFPWNSWLIGWDALSHELNLAAAFNRVFSASWQENQALGMLGGHGYAAILPHVLVLSLLNLLVPAHAVRALFTFLTWYAGIVGMYVFIQYFLKQLYRHDDTSKTQKVAQITASIIGALYYGLNLATLQMFYIQTDSFIAHFALIPWTLFILEHYLLKGSRRYGALLFLILFLGSFQGFIPPTFLIYAGLLTLLLLWHNIRSPSPTIVSRTRFTILLAFAVNLYWVLPFGYYAITKGSINAKAYNNLYTTENFQDQNYAYGNLYDIMLLKGYMLDLVEGAEGDTPVSIFEPLLDHLNTPGVELIGIIFFILSLYGLTMELRKASSSSKHIQPLTLALVSFWLICFTGLAMDVFPFSYVSQILQRIPLINQAFRTPFTKFSLGLASMYSVFLGFGMHQLHHTLHHVLKKKNPAKYGYYTISAICVVLLIIFVYPFLSGTFLYYKTTQNIPTSYHKLISFFQNQPKEDRIALLPQGCAEGWTTHHWGYIGSGFLHYALEQPILDRAFDVWSRESENYYWELVYALRTRRFDRLDQIIKKYDINWLIIDQNVRHCRDTKGFAYLPDLFEHLDTSPLYKQQMKFSQEKTLPITVYRYIEQDTDTFITSYTSIPNIGPIYQHTDNDQALSLKDTYMTDESSLYDAYLPFRSLFSKRGTNDHEFEIAQTENEFVFSNPLLIQTERYALQVPNYYKTTSTIPVMLRAYHKTEDLVNFSITFLTPDIYINDDKFLSQRFSHILGTFSRTDANIHPEQQILYASINDIPLPLKKIEAKEAVFESPVMLVSTDNLIDIRLGTKQQVFFSDTVRLRNLLSNSSETYLSLPLPKDATRIAVRTPIVLTEPFGHTFSKELLEKEPEDCTLWKNPGLDERMLISQDNVQMERLINTKSSSCIAYELPDIPEKVGYIASLTHRNFKGRSLLFYTTSNTSRSYDINIYLPQTNVLATTNIVIPPGYPYGLGKTLFLENTSLTKNPSINDIASFSLSPFPYAFLTGIQLIPREKTKLVLIQSSHQPSVWHPHPAFYRLSNVKRSDTNSIKLSQSYDSAWLLLAKYPNTFLLKPAGSHVVINNWANGWILPKINTQTEPLPESYIILYWPQLLQWLGLLFLPTSLFFLFRKHA